jgi:hypothetical protein
MNGVCGAAIATRYVKLDSRSVPRRPGSIPNRDKRPARTKDGNDLHVLSEYRTRHLHGIATDADSFESLPDVIARVHCPHCGERHDWPKYNAFPRRDGTGTPRGGER